MTERMKRRTVMKACASMLFMAIPQSFSHAKQTQKVPRNHGPVTREIVPYTGSHRPGTIIISNSKRIMDFVLSSDQAARYSVAIGRDGFSWTGEVVVARKTEWPTWRPPAEMRQRQPDLPVMVPPGPFNPLGARAIYLFQNGRDTLYRIHGTNNAATVGGFETSGCFRMTNADVLEFYKKVKIGARVIVLS